MRIFALNASRDFGGKLAFALGVPIDEHEERDFEDGEHKARPLVSVRGEDVYVLQQLHGSARESVNDKLCKLLFFRHVARGHRVPRLRLPVLARIGEVRNDSRHA
ncbi:ribose-phosphate pyrophosphokinase-like domain-containing protein [Sinorhizobium psoraleae]|uniref:ribose-phosphate pyrophosphokinase-like domain-containing protein n=1 Tax=Sinorhizobium psoraleae TaxID=520838 RepID=UPI001FE4022B|nr:ribose-phosphate pyrophosphokinase-like domain-containing protein [Sinorhizobium psoraleae]